MCHQKVASQERLPFKIGQFACQFACLANANFVGLSREGGCSPGGPLHGGLTVLSSVF